MSQEERRKSTLSQVIGTVTGVLNIVLMVTVLLGGVGAFYELKSQVVILNNTLTDLRNTVQEMNRQIAQIDDRVRKVEIRTR